MCVLKEHTPQTAVNTLIPRPLTVDRIAYTVVRLGTVESTRGVISQLYHCRQYAVDIGSTSAAVI